MSQSEATHCEHSPAKKPKIVSDISDFKSREKKLSLSSHDESTTITLSVKRKLEAKPEPAKNQKIVSDVSKFTVREKEFTKHSEI